MECKTKYDSPTYQTAVGDILFCLHALALGDRLYGGDSQAQWTLWRNRLCYNLAQIELWEVKPIASGNSWAVDLEQGNAWERVQAARRKELRALETVDLVDLGRSVYGRELPLCQAGDGYRPYSERLEEWTSERATTPS